jgi:hypothetical protein
MIIAVLFAVVTLTQAQQDKHDAAELAMYTQLKADQDAIAEIWRPSPKLLSDFRAARRCYTQFHLYKVESCEEQFQQVDRDLFRVVE